MKCHTVLLITFVIHLGSASAQSLFHLLDDVNKGEKPIPSSLQLSNDPDVQCAEYKDILSNIILKFIEQLRTHMDTGIPSLDIPPLDPLHIENTTFHSSKPFQYKVDGAIGNTVVEGLKSFNVTHISTSFFHLQANLSIEIPYFFVTGRYNLAGKILTVVPVKGNGPYTLSPSNTVALITAKLRLQHSYLQLTSLDFDISMSNLFVKFEGLYGGGKMGKFVNSVMNKFGLSAFHRIEPKVHEKLRISLMNVINEKLKEIPLSELIGMFDPKPACKHALLTVVENENDDST